MTIYLQSSDDSVTPPLTAVGEDGIEQLRADVLMERSEIGTAAGPAWRWARRHRLTALRRQVSAAGRTLERQPRKIPKHTS